MTTTSTTIDRMLGIGRRMADVALVAVIGLGLGALVIGRGLPVLGHPVFIVAGPSMEPAIPIGSVVVLSAVEPDAMVIGDVVSLHSGPSQAVFTHRITRIVERGGTTWIETRGDANEAPDPSLTPTEAVIGRVAISLPTLGYLLALVSSPIGVVFALSSGGALLVVGWLLDDVIATRRRRRQPAAAPLGRGRRRSVHRRAEPVR
jgi:signal peptidase I